MGNRSLNSGSYILNYLESYSYVTATKLNLFRSVYEVLFEVINGPDWFVLFRAGATPQLAIFPS